MIRVIVISVYKDTNVSNQVSKLWKAGLNEKVQCLSLVKIFLRKEQNNY